MTAQKMTTTAIGLCMALSAGTATAENYTAAVTWNDVHPITENNFTQFAKNVEEATDGEVTFEVFHSSAILPPSGTLSGLASGIASYAHITSAYMPQDLPVDNVLNDLSMVSTDPLLDGIAMTEVKLLSSDIQAENSKHGVVFGNGYSTSEYIFICADDIETLADLKGKKIRGAGSALISMIEHFEAVPVSVPATEIYTGLQRGSVDCALGDPSFMTTGFKLQEVAKSALILGVGTHTSGGNYFDLEFWEGLTPELRRTMLDELARTTVELGVDWKQRGKDAIAEAESNGVEIIEPIETDQATMTAYKKDFSGSLAETAKDSRKVENADAIIQQYLDVRAKWEKRLVDVDQKDVEAMAKMVREEIYDKVDAETYGLK